MNVKMLNKSNNELDKEINEESSSIMTDIVCYLRVANISDYYQEIVRRDLLEMVLSAQDRGESIQSVIGEDYKTFCDEVIENLPKRTRKERILDFCETFFLCAAILGGINLILSKEIINLLGAIISGQPLNFQMPITASSILLFGINIIAAFIFVEIICKTALNPKKEKHLSKPKRFMLGGLAGGGVMAVFIVIAWFGKNTLFTVNMVVYCVVVLGLLAAYKIVKIIE
ncbi:hypothetical protein [Acetobacterium bakii]|uniref:DUF1048 domain-containing protein n=1 Tax=Acetobacterium bakii TaxID=52689 RepID=A0A0L6TYE4_9FIRM|nr:hypothetical protein [Acetobacterium bakii]KNZ41268.1 hypothetical protein AKG39_13235 [Acetobacterium bakii]